jgi:hypothetical protein
VATSDEMRELVEGLSNDPRRPVRGFMGAVGERVPLPSCHLTLAAWATEIAESVHSRFGDEVAVTVGALSFPGRTFSPKGGGVVVYRPPENLPRLGPEQVAASLSGELAVRSGFDVVSELQLRNLGTRELTIWTNGNLTARFLDPTSGEIVGGFTGAQELPGILFHAAPGETIVVPLLVGTNSLVPALGYAIPPGQWAIDAVLDLGNEGRYVTPTVPITVLP